MGVPERLRKLTAAGLLRALPVLFVFLTGAGYIGSRAQAAPTITGISPSSVAAGSPGFTLTIRGTGFMGPFAVNPISAGSEVRWNGSRLETNWINDTELTAGIPAALVASPGTARIIVVNPIEISSDAVALTIQAGSSQGSSPPPALAITSPSSLPNGVVEVAYSQALAASGGTLPRRWSVRAGVLPAGLRLDGSSGVLAGTPAVSGNFSFEVQVEDNARVTSTKGFTLTVFPPLAIASGSALPRGVVGVGYSQTLAVTGGMPPHRWAIQAGAVPPGLTLDSSTGVIGGMPSSPGSFEFTVGITDALQMAASKAFTITIDARTAIAAVANGASFLPGPVAPGTIMTIFGTEIGPASPVRLQLNASGRLDSALGETRVLFDGTPAPLIYAQAAQVSAVVPYTVVGRSATEVQIEFQGTRSRSITLAVADSAPAIFTLDSSGRGQGAILNQNGSVNSVPSPAPAGSIVILYATGDGQTDPPGVDGRLAADPLPKPRLPVSVSIGGMAAEVLYAGAAPGLVAGALQVNARIPEGVGPGSAVPVLLQIGGAVSQPGVTLAVR